MQGDGAIRMLTECPAADDSVSPTLLDGRSNNVGETLSSVLLVPSVKSSATVTQFTKTVLVSFKITLQTTLFFLLSVNAYYCLTFCSGSRQLRTAWVLS